MFPENRHDPIKKSDYKNKTTQLRTELLNLQLQISHCNRPVVIIIAGDDRSGRHESINTLMEWLDPRFIRVNAYRPSQQQDEQKPFFWRYWRDLPAAGHIGIYLREWTSTSIVQFLNNDIDQPTLDQRIRAIRDFESTLIHDGTLLIKVWLHLSRQAHEERVNKARDTLFFDPKDELALQNYNLAMSSIESILQATETEQSTWQIINGEDAMHRNLAIGELVANTMRQWLASSESPSLQPPVAPDKPVKSLLKKIDLTQSMDKKEYQRRLSNAEDKLKAAMNQAHEQGKAVVCVFEGVDAAGKGGAIRRIATSLDAGLYRIVPISKPNDLEASHHYLWRFWRNIPASGLLTIFDRSWYGRVLVERVEDFAATDEWQRAYQEINEFEHQLVEHGIILLKFWLHIDQDEQLSRFQAREKTEHKKHKITDEDYRNREKWPLYEDAIEDMLQKTDTDFAPWHCIAAQDKRFARVQVIETLINTLEES